MKIVSNASPLIYLSKIGRLDLLKNLFGLVIAPQAVWEEVVVNGEQNYPTESRLVKEACAQKWLVIEIIHSNLSFPEIDRGEAEVIQLALHNNISSVLIDDATGRKIAEAYGLQTRGTLFVILESLRKKLITQQDAEDLLNRLATSGFRMSIEVYAECFKIIRKRV